MHPTHPSRLFACCLVAGVAMVCCLASSEPAEPTKETSRADPEHVASRLYEALFVRVGPDGHRYGQDRLEPLLWRQSRHLLEGKSHQRAAALLQELLRDRGEKQIAGPLERAMLQRELWLVFSWLEGSHDFFGETVLTPEKVQAAVARLRRPLAAVIRRLALSPEQIRRLPDNYADAVRSGTFARRFDPDQPDRPHLPPDLFAAGGPWVCVGRPDGPVAPEHLRDDGTTVFTNSAFLVFLRLPAGRAATLAYLKRLRSFNQPLLVKPEGPGSRSEQHLPNPKTPQLPVGTEMALVRRALLIDSSHKVQPSPLTESVQLRVYREVPDMTVQTFDAALVGGTAASRRAQQWQAVQEFRLRRSLLFAGRAGGLCPVGADERDFKTGFGSHPFDVFENTGYRPPDRSFAEASQIPVRDTCFACHSLPGVFSFNSFFHYRVNLQPRDGQHPFSLTEMPVAEVARAAVKWKEGRPNWTGLRKLLAESAP
jgi:hypothetical protein